MDLPKSAMLALAACMGLAGPASAQQSGLLSRSGNVIAILADELLLGEAVGNTRGAGTVAIRSLENPGLICTGEFTSSAELGGQGQLRCSDGADATFRFDRLTLTRGHGNGTFSRGPMSFTYGLSAEESRPYLRLPAGKRLRQSGTTLEF